MLTGEQVEMLEALLAKATPGEWAQYGPDVTDAEGVPLFGLLGAKEADDTALVVAMKAALPALLQLARAVNESPQARVYVIGTGEGEDLLTLEPRDRQDREAIRASVGAVALVPVPVKEGAK